MATETTRAHVTIDITDVVRAGSVPQAILAWAEESDDTSSGVVGPAFSTSGPGSGWSRDHDRNDFARRAVVGGALHYIDEGDGRMISAEEVSDDERDDDGEWPDDVIHDMGGGHSRLGDWTDASVVRVECPSVEDAIHWPGAVAEMAQSVIGYHGPCSDRAAWRALLASIRDAAQAIEDTDIDDLEAE